MLTVRVKITGWLRQGVQSISSDAFAISVPDGETVLGLVGRLARKEAVLWRAIIGDQSEELGATVLVALNGRLVNPHDRAEAALRDGDEVTFLPSFDGG